MAQNPNAAPWKALPAEPWAVYYTRQKADGIDFRLFLAFDKSADEKAGQPFTRKEAEALAEQLASNQQNPPLTVMALPLEQILQAGV
jgi:hypothetical protein